MNKSYSGGLMYEHISVVGQRGQITIPKIIRENEGIKENDKVIVKIEGNQIVIEKQFDKKEKEKQMVEGYKKMAKLNLELCKEWEVTEKEANRYLDEY